MATADGIRAGRAYVELFTDDSALVRGLTAAQQRLERFGAAVRALGTKFLALGTGIVAPLALAAHSFAETGSRLNDLSTSTGFSVEALSELAYAAQQSSASLDDIERGARTLQGVIASAATGGHDAADALARVGVSAKALLTLSPQQQFEAIAIGLRAVPDPAQRAASAIALLGRSGTELLPMINDLESLRAEARRLGLVMTTGQAKAADDLGDAFDRVRASLQGVVNAIGLALAPTLQAIASDVVGMLVGLREWVARNDGVVTTLAAIGVVVAGVGAGLIGLGIAISALAAGFGGLATLASVVGSTLGAVAAGLAALATPIGAVVAGTAAIAATVLATTNTGQRALVQLGHGFQSLEDDALGAWSGIADALAAGDIGLAAHLLWAGLKLEWQRGSAFLLDVWDSAIAGVAQVFTQTWFGIEDVFTGVVDAMATAWDDLVAGLTKLWNSAVGAIAAKLTRLLEMIGLADEGVNLQIEQETSQKNDAVDTERRSRAHQRDQDQVDLDQQRQAVLAGISDDLVGKVQERDAGIEQARAELDAARAEAATAHAATRQRLDETGDRTAVSPDFATALSALANAPAAIAQKLDHAGTFSGVAVGGLGVGTTASERTAKATEDTAKTTLRILREFQNASPLAFD